MGVVFVFALVFAGVLVGFLLAAAFGGLDFDDDIDLDDEQ